MSNGVPKLLRFTTLVCSTISLALVLALPLAQAKWEGKAEQNANTPIAVAVATTTQGDLPVYMEGLGTVSALNTVTVRSRVEGELLRVLFQEGQEVQQGELLAEIDPRAFQVQLQQAEGQLHRDAALLKNAELDWSRYQTLLAQDSIAAQQVATQAALVQQYRGTVTIDKAQVANAQLLLSYCKITAPVSGRVGLRLLDQGNMVRANDSNGLVVITQTQPISVVFSLPEDNLPAIMQRWRANAQLMVAAYNRAGKTLLAKGKLMAIDNQIDATTGTVKLKAQFTNDQRNLFVNQFVNVKMQLDTLRGVTLVPTAAIQHGTIGAFVYVVNPEQTVSVRPVKLGQSVGETVAVLEGLTPKQTVVVDGADKLREGTAITVLAPTPPPANPAAAQAH